MMLSLKYHTQSHPVKLKNLMKCRTKVCAVDVDKVRKRMRRPLCHVTNLKKGASASKGSEVAQTSVNAWAVKTHMEIFFYQEQKTRSIAGTRKRRPAQMTSESMSGRDFMGKRPCQGIVCQWTFLEELVLAQLIQGHFPNNDIDIAIIYVQFQQLVDNATIHSKTMQQITKKVMIYLSDNETFQTLFKEQVRLNWFV